MQSEPEQVKQETTEGKADTEKRAWFLFGLGLLFYLLTRFVGLDRFPIYFFSDEAIQTMSAVDLIGRGFKDVDGSLFPIYFQNGSQYNLSLSVWLQVLIAWLPRSVWLTRGLPALISLVFPLSAGLWAKDFFKAKFWWLMPLVVAVIPAWFLHSRTAFETSLGASFFSLFLFFYLKYRLQKREFLYLALLFGAFSFYSYSPLQLVVVCVSLVLLLVDWKYHFKQKKYLLLGLGFLILLAAPYVYFQISHQQALSHHLSLLNSYWVSRLPLWKKISLYLGQWLQGLNPLYWFFENTTDLVRHQMKNLGHLPWFFLPFFLLGFWQSLRNFKKAEYRSVLIAWLLGPVGAAIAGISITRVLVMVIPFSLMIFLGLEAAISFFDKKLRLRPILIWVASLSLVLFGSWMTWYALTSGPLWYPDYSLYGMQWGGQQLSEKIVKFQETHPESRLKLSPKWANNTDVIMRYFLGDPLPLEIGTLEEYDLYPLQLDDDLVFIMGPDELQWTRENPKFAQLELLDSLNWPDGRVGFSFLRLAYSEEAEAIFALEMEQRRQPDQTEFDLNGQRVSITHSKLDLGSLAHIFDGSSGTLARTLEANPLIITIDFPQPVSLQKVTVLVGSPPTRLTVTVIEEDSGQASSLTVTVSGSDRVHPLSVAFDSPRLISRLTVSVESLYEDPPTHVHLWELILE